MKCYCSNRLNAHGETDWVTAKHSRGDLAGLLAPKSPLKIPPDPLAPIEEGDISTMISYALRVSAPRHAWLLD